MTDHSYLADFYQRNNQPLPEGIGREVGHFNVFDTQTFFDKQAGTRVMPYSRRDYYKISWLRGNSRVEYADKVIDIRENALLFATPRIPYHWLPVDHNQTGMFCIFTADFLAHSKTGVHLDELPLFQPGQVPVFQLGDTGATEIDYIFRKMHREIGTDYPYKYDLLRNIVLELIHSGQKLQPLSTLSATRNASERISSLFLELLERQFPLDSSHQRLSLRTAKDYADRLAVHVNHLNRVLKEVTGHTTTDLIGRRVMEEAKIMLKQTNWSVAEVGYHLGFDDPSRFSHYVKKQTSFTPQTFRA